MSGWIIPGVINTLDGMAFSTKQLKLLYFSVYQLLWSGMQALMKFKCLVTIVEMIKL